MLRIVKKLCRCTSHDIAWYARLKNQIIKVMRTNHKAGASNITQSEENSMKIDHIIVKFHYKQNTVKSIMVKILQKRKKGMNYLPKWEDRSKEIFKEISKGWSMHPCRKPNKHSLLHTGYLVEKQNLKEPLLPISLNSIRLLSDSSSLFIETSSMAPCRYFRIFLLRSSKKRNNTRA